MSAASAVIVALEKQGETGRKGASLKGTKIVRLP